MICLLVQHFPPDQTGVLPTGFPAKMLFGASTSGIPTHHCPAFVGEHQIQPLSCCCPRVPLRDMEISIPFRIKSVPLMDGTEDALTTQNRLLSPLLRLPGELRNAIYTYAFTESNILVRRYASPSFQIRVEPSGYPRTTTRRYPLYQLLNQRAICREIYSETTGLIFRSNEFRFHHVEVITHFVRDMPRVHLDQIENVRLAFDAPPSDEFMRELGKCGLDELRGTKKVVVETKSWEVGLISSRKRRWWTEGLFQRVMDGGGGEVQFRFEYK